jgi:outer membrane protein
MELLKMRYIAYGLAAILGVSLLSTPSHAQTTGGIAIEIPDIDNFVGGGIGIVPDYVGSDDYTVGAAPVARIQIGKGERFAKLTITELTVNVLDNEQWSLGPLLNYRLGRDDVDDDAVDRMNEIDDAVELGVFGGWTWISKNDPRARLNLSLSAKQDVVDSHDGYLVDASARYFTPLSRSFVLSFGGSTTYGSSDYMDTYFGVDARDATVTGLSQFSASDGFRDVRLSVMAIQSLSVNWHLAGGLVYSRLLGDASDSPVVDDRGDENQYFLGAGAVYAW